MTMKLRSLIARGLIGSGVAAALRTLRKTRYEKEKKQQEAAISAWEGEGGSSATQDAATT